MAKILLTNAATTEISATVSNTLYIECASLLEEGFSVGELRDCVGTGVEPLSVLVSSCVG